jgi:hypothetical protein
MIIIESSVIDAIIWLFGALLTVVNYASRVVNYTGKIYSSGVIHDDHHMMTVICL